MGLINMASGYSIWDGHVYYKDKRVKDFQKLSNNEFSCKSLGKENKIYYTYINLLHPRQSKCTCPHANGKRVICKHMIALYFQAFPDENLKYEKEIEDYELQEEQRELDEQQEIINYVKKLSAKEAKNILIEKLLEERKHW